MSTYLSLVDVEGHSFQNAQELIAAWGSARDDVERLGGELRDAFALLGSYDFAMVYDAQDEDAALRIAIALERYGLRTQTMQAVSTGRLADIVEDM